MRNRRSFRQSGLTMLEVIIASVILSVIVMMASWLVWSSADHVSNTESWIKMEADAREVVDQMVKELHQCRRGKVKKMDTTRAIPTDSTSMAADASPGTPVDYTPWDPANPADPATLFDGIRFRTAASMMELTAVTTKQTVMTDKGSVDVNGSGPSGKVMQNNASADDNGKIDPNDPAKKKKIWNFDLAKFKADASKDGVEWLYEVTYWWEIDQNANVGKDASATRGEGRADTNSPSGYLPDGLDNNQNGVVDEGVIKKMETWFDPTGKVERRIVTTICRDVTALHFSVPGWPAWVNASTLGADKAASKYKSTEEKMVTISLTLRRPDPRYPKDALKSYSKTVTATVDLRN